MKHTKIVKIFSGSFDSIAERLQAYILENHLLIGHITGLICVDCPESNPTSVRLFLTHNERESCDPQNRLAKVGHFVTTKRVELMEKEFEVAVTRRYEDMQNRRLEVMGQSKRPDGVPCLYWFAIYH